MIITTNKYLKINSLFLGNSILIFGLLKFVNPFHAWYLAQITTSQLPPFLYEMGIAGEIAVGFGLILPFVLKGRISFIYEKLLWISSTLLIFMMLVATYVHLHPAVPAEVLPLKIKPPIIPLIFLLMSGFNLKLLFSYQEKVNG